jgi:hypothetical protein
VSNVKCNSLPGVHTQVIGFPRCKDLGSLDVLPASHRLQDLSKIEFSTLKSAWMTRVNYVHAAIAYENILERAVTDNFVRSMKADKIRCDELEFIGWHLILHVLKIRVSLHLRLRVAPESFESLPHHLADA